MAQKLPLTRPQYEQEFDFFWNIIRTNCFYFNLWPTVPGKAAVPDAALLLEQ